MYQRTSLLERVVFLLPEEELSRIDAWGGPAGMASRSQAIRELIKAGLAVKAQTKKPELSA